MTTTDRAEKVIRQWQSGFITLPELVCELAEIDYLSTLDGTLGTVVNGVVTVDTPAGF